MHEGGVIITILTGDTHRDFKHIGAKLNTTIADTLIILGDAGINYYGGNRDLAFKRELSMYLPISILAVHGNHERRPERVSTYREACWHGGIVYAEPQFPNLLFARDGEVYEIEGKRCIAIGGAYSVDKPLRLAEGWHWFADEQPSPKIKARVEQRLAAEGWKVDVVLSHTCPLKYEPRETFIKGINQSAVDKSTEIWLDSIEDRLSYKKWLCGHFHCSKIIDRVRFMFEDFIEL